MANEILEQSTAAAEPSVTAAEYTSWGRYPRVLHRKVHHAYWSDQLPRILEDEQPRGALPYGLGRSYGDSCLNAGRDLIDCSRMNRVLGFDFHHGRMRCEAGMTLAGILEIAVPNGWFLPVTPGTKFVTLGGAIANDVHGKNHHRAGTIGRHIRGLALYRSDRGLIPCSAESEPELFRATIGGLGLTGVIVWAEIQLVPIQGPWIDVETVPFRSLDEFSSISQESDAGFDYTVAWIDCLSGEQTRGIFYRGNHSASTEPAPAAKPGPAVPFAFPGIALNRLTVGLFNNLYFRRNSRKPPKTTVHYDPFFYPLDSVRDWNLIYGKNGFLQYQCVIPESSFGSLKELMKQIGDSGMGSFLAVLKCFGPIASPGMLSFPRPGYTLALDFPMRGRNTLKLMSALDEMVLGCGGALYPAKDARMSSRAFEMSFPQWQSFRNHIDPKLSSSFWRRVTGER